MADCNDIEAVEVKSVGSNSGSGFEDKSHDDNDDDDGDQVTLSTVN